MVGLAHGHDADAGRLRLLDGLLHGERADHLPHAGMAVDDGAHGRLEDDFRHGVDMDQPLFDSLVVADHALHAMALDAVQVGGQEHVADPIAVALVEPERPEHVGAELLQRFEFPGHVCHFLLSCWVSGTP